MSQTSVTYGDSDTDIFSFDNSTGRMSGFKFTVGANSMAGTLGWNANWTLGSMAITDGLTPANSQNCSYGHDALARISSTVCTNTSGTNVWGQDFTFDAFGNLSKSVPSGDTGTSFLPTYSAATNQYTLSACTVTYDANGDLTNDCLNTYTWNVYGNPATIGPKSLTFDAFGREAEIASGSTYTQILYSPIGKLGTMNGQTPKITRYPLPGGGTAEIQGNNGTKDILHADWLGSARLSTTYTDQTVVNDTAYAPYGETYNNTSTSNLNFTGQSQDTQTGLYDFPYREYSPVGRWVSPDPAGLTAVDITNPQSWNRYAYVGNNPLDSLDPTGLGDCPIPSSQSQAVCQGGYFGWSMFLNFTFGFEDPLSTILVPPDNAIYDGPVCFNCSVVLAGVVSPTTDLQCYSPMAFCNGASAPNNAPTVSHCLGVAAADKGASIVLDALGSIPAVGNAVSAGAGIVRAGIAVNHVITSPAFAVGSGLYGAYGGVTAGPEEATDSLVGSASAGTGIGLALADASLEGTEAIPLVGNAVSLLTLGWDGYQAYKKCQSCMAGH